MNLIRHSGAERSEEPEIHIYKRGGYGFRARRLRGAPE